MGGFAGSHNSYSHESRHIVSKRGVKVKSTGTPNGTSSYSPSSVFLSFLYSRPKDDFVGHYAAFVDHSLLYCNGNEFTQYSDHILPGSSNLLTAFLVTAGSYLGTNGLYNCHTMTAYDLENARNSLYKSLCLPVLSRLKKWFSPPQTSYLMIVFSW